MRYLLALFGFSALFSSAVQAQVKVPFILQENKCVFVEVKVNDHPTPLLFFFDTGAGSIMLSQEVAEQLNIKPTYTETISGAEGQTLILGDKIVLENVDFIFDDTSRLAKSFGRKFDGIVGYDFLHKYMTKVDFDHKEFWVYESPEQVDTKGFTKHAITMSEDIPIPHFDVTFRLKDESAYTGQVLFDSGAGLNLLINSKFQQQHNLLDKMPNRLTASQNDYEFDKPMIAHISTDKSGVSAMPGYLGILGAEIINRFNFIIDYENNLLYLEPNTLYDMTMDTTVFPFRLVLENGKILVNHLIENTDAAKQGIKAGDEILEVNNQPVKDLVWTKEQIKATKGAVHLKIRKSDGAVVNKTFRLTTL
jgi:predicted aspartyl protease